MTLRSAETNLPKLHNIVATANFGQNLDLKKVQMACANAEYNPKKFSACIVRIRAPEKSTALVFSSGRVVITGAKSEEHAWLATKSYAKMVSKTLQVKINGNQE